MTKCVLWGALAGACLLVAHAQSATEQKWSPEAAARYMDERQAWWQSWDHAKRDHDTRCVSCHTQVPFAMARPLLREELHEEGASKTEKAMLADDEEGRDLRQISPFAGALSPEDRLVAMKKVQLLAKG